MLTTRHSKQLKAYSAKAADFVQSNCGLLYSFVQSFIS
jgi:hypothetical protein